MLMWMYGYSWPAVFWMVGGALFWIALLSVATWLFARWAGHMLGRMDAATRHLDHARDELLRARDATTERKRPALSAPGAGGAGGAHDVHDVHDVVKRL